jgi:hypothetical protein
MIGCTTSNNLQLIRYCSADGSVKILKSPRGYDNPFLKSFKVKVHNDNIFLFRYASIGRGDIQVDVYDTLQDSWTQKASFQHVGLISTFKIAACYWFDGKIYALLRYSHFDDRNVSLCVTYCISTDTWQTVSTRYPVGIENLSATTCGGNIYLSTDLSTELYQYNPSTQQLTEIVWQSRPSSLSDLMFGEPVTYQNKILFLAQDSKILTLAAFNTETNDFQTYPILNYYTRYIIEMGLYLGNKLTVFQKNMYVVVYSSLHDEDGYRVFKFDLSFMDEMKEPVLLPLLDCHITMTDIESIVSIQ